MDQKAFPKTVTDWNPDREQWEVGSVGGMDLRDYFAAKALPVVVAGNYEMGQTHLRYERFEETALDAYKMADAMMKARTA
jgi:hypothetical protein